MPGSNQIINVISTKRSGHHAFIYWLTAGLPDAARFRNNSVIGSKLEAEITAFAAGSDAAAPTTLILNYEGVSPAGLARAWGYQTAAGVAAQDILFLRDPLNLCASLIHRKAFAIFDLLMLLRQLIAERDWLTMHAAQPARAIDLVLYNPWLADPDYKRALATRLRLQASGAHAKISHHGGGSSFKDLDTVEGHEDIAKLAQRWKLYRGHRLFEALVGHAAFSPWFERMVCGGITDCLGRTDKDDERAAYLADLGKRRRGHMLVDRILATLEREPQLLHRIESNNGQGKKRVLLEAHLKALAPWR